MRPGFTCPTKMETWRFEKRDIVGIESDVSGFFFFFFMKHILNNVDYREFPMLTPPDIYKLAKRLSSPD